MFKLFKHYGQSLKVRWKSVVKVVTVDVRMYNSSGIGTYIVNVLPRIIKSAPNIVFYLLGNKDELSSYRWSKYSNVKLVDCRSSIYSMKEQIELVLKIPTESDLFWSPHYCIPLLYSGKLLVTVHDVFHLAMPEFVKWHQRLYAKAMFTVVCRKATKIITVSQFTKSELQRLVSGTHPPIVPIYNGVDPGWCNFDPGFSPHPRQYIACVGNVKPHKNLALALESFKEICDRIPHDFLIIGKKDGFLTGDKRVVHLANELQGRVQLLGILPESELKRYVGHADALIFPSLYEGFGLPPLEAMACGCPVLASSAASIPEVCGDSALYFNPRDPKELSTRLLDLLQDEKLRIDLSRQGRARSKLFDWDRCSNSTLALIREVLAN